MTRASEQEKQDAIALFEEILKTEDHELILLATISMDFYLRSYLKGALPGQKKPREEAGDP